MSIRTPLADHSYTNVHQSNRRPQHHEGDKISKPGIQSVKRVNAEGPPIATSNGQDRPDIMQLQLELEAAKMEMQTQKETIIRLSAAKSESRNSGTQEKLNKLVGKYEAMKGKFEADLASAKTDNQSLSSLVDSLQSTSGDMQKTITSLRSDKAALQQRLHTVESTQQSTKGESESKFKEERVAWRKEKMELEDKLKHAFRDVSKLETARKESERMEIERDEALERIDQVTFLYRLLYRSSVPVIRLQEAEECLAEARNERDALRTKCEIVSGRNKGSRGAQLDLKDQLIQSQKERNVLLDTIQHLQSERSLDRAQHSVANSDQHSIEPIPIEDSRPTFDLALRQIDLTTTHHTTLITDLISSLTSLRSDLDIARSSLSEAELVSLTNRQAIRTLEDQLSEAQSIHADCGEQIINWRSESTRAKAMESRLRCDLTDTRVKLQEVEERMIVDRDHLRRANESNKRSGAAIQALEDDVQVLQDRLAEHDRLTSRLDEVIQDRDLLQLRLDSAEEELERVGQQNAEMMGSSGNHDGQRITYMEGMRREMAIVKHELATARHNLNIANDRVASLQTEVDSLKSISPTSLASAGARVRVSRSHVKREPEGGEVLSASLARRASGAPLPQSQGQGWR